MKKNGLYKRMLVIAIVPILILGIAITLLCYVRFTHTIYDRAREDMRNVSEAAALAYDYAFPGDYMLVKAADDTYNLYKGEEKITDFCDIVDTLSEETGSEISLLYMDMRINTTFKYENGSRMTGVCTNSDTSEKVLNGEETFYEEVPVGNESYLVLYVPLQNSDGSYIGMIEVARTVSEMKKAVLRAIWPVMLAAALGMVLAIFVTLKNTKEITAALKKVQLFMNTVSGGNLSPELDTKVLSREDELGDIAKSAVSMQRSIRGFVETDPLTKLGNRRYIGEQFKKLQDKANKSGQPFSLAICDIDFFKKVNDTYGHNAGDEVLKAVAATLKSEVNARGFAGRWGGEEFIVAFDRCGVYDAADRLWSILGKIREMTVSADGYEIKVTMTFGVVEAGHNSLEETVEAADAKLYYGKQNGRNRVVVDMEEK